MKALPLTITILTMVYGSVSAQELNRRPPTDILAAHRVPADVVRLVSSLQNAGLFDKASSVIEVHRRNYPWDPDLPRLGLELAFLRSTYADMTGYLKMPVEFQQAFPFVWQTMFDGTRCNLMFYVAHINGIKTGRDSEALDSEVLKEAWAKRESLPFGMVDEDGVHVDKQVLTLLLLRDSFGGSHRKLLFDRAAKLAPNDSFILEMKAKLLLDDGEEAKAVEMYKKALKAKASEARIKYLKKELVEAEKLAEYRKVIGPRTDRKGGG
jgi:hypothetical protein